MRGHSPIGSANVHPLAGTQVQPSSSRASLMAQRRGGSSAAASGGRGGGASAVVAKPDYPKGIPGHDVLIESYGDTTERIQIRAKSGQTTQMIPASAGQFGVGHSNKSVLGSSVNFSSPPSDPSGRMVDMSDRPLSCSSYNGIGEIVIGGTDHALYAIDLNSSRKAATKLYHKRWGHTDWVTGCAHLASGRILSCGMDSKLCLWSLDKKRCQDLMHHHRSISAVVAGQLDMAYSASYDCTVVGWSLASSERATEGVTPSVVWKGHKSPVLELASQDTIVASGGKDGAIVCWDATSGDCIMRMRAHDATITKLLLSPHNGLLISGSADGFIKTWDPRMKDLLTSIGLHRDQSSGSGAPVGGLACVGEHLLVSGGADNVVHVMDRRRDGPVHSFNTCRTGVYSLIAAPDERCVFVGDGAGILSCFDVKVGRLCYGIGASETGAVRCIVPVSSTSQIVTAGEDGKALVFSY